MPKNCKTRQYTSPSPRTILITLPSERHRDNIISAVKRYNKDHPQTHISSNLIGVSGADVPIFVANHLSPEGKDLHAAARKYKAHGYKFVWVKFGRVYVRKDEESPHIHIKDKSSLEKLPLYK